MTAKGRCWQRGLPDSSNNVRIKPGSAFIDPKTFTVLKAGPITNGGSQGIGKCFSLRWHNHFAPIP